ncbi:beta-lactamase family protein [Xanthomonas euvesicatoria pv. physalidis]|nr:serine hydrolase [Xanthomonas euvesicatoria]MBV6687008.1 beta-lactamase family protein [Xanthomonas euvesicatoria pv. physalidis]MBV6795638.1 beta-lactamase family protein [Xanthomonas campestris pv. daturae]
MDLPGDHLLPVAGKTAVRRRRRERGSSRGALSLSVKSVTAPSAVSVVHNGKPLFRVVDGLADLDTTQPATPEQLFAAFSVGKRFVWRLCHLEKHASPFRCTRRLMATCGHLPMRYVPKTPVLQTSLGRGVNTAGSTIDWQREGGSHARAMGRLRR